MGLLGGEGVSSLRRFALDPGPFPGLGCELTLNQFGSRPLHVKTLVVKRTGLDIKPPETLALKGLPTMCWGPPYLMEIR